MSNNDFFDEKGNRSDFFIALAVIGLFGFLIFNLLGGKEKLELENPIALSENTEIEKDKTEEKTLAITDTDYSLDNSSTTKKVGSSLDAAALGSAAVLTPTILSSNSNKKCDRKTSCKKDCIKKCKKGDKKCKKANCPQKKGDSLSIDTKGPAIISAENINSESLDSDGDGVNNAEDNCPGIAGDAENNGCPKQAELTKQETKDLSIAKQNIEFKTGSAVIKDSSKKNLDLIAEILNHHPDYKIAIQGHTDSQGKADKNLNLSKERAQACADYLAQKGIKAERIKSNGYGDKKPIADNSTPQGREKNRRVEFNIY